MQYSRHHLLEIILWPNEDGTFTEIRNSAKRLKKLGIYNDFKMCILISQSEHASLHGLGKDRIGKTTSTCWKPGHKTWNKGIPCSDKHKEKISAGVKIGMQKNWDKFLTANREAVKRGEARRNWLTTRYQELKAVDPSITWNSVQKKLNAEWKEVKDNEAHQL